MPRAIRRNGGARHASLDDDRPKKKLSHEIGQELALLSIEELTERIALLKDEIARLEAAIAAKESLAHGGGCLLPALRPSRTGSLRLGIVPICAQSSFTDLTFSEL